jgi:hypothetical protein
MQAGIVTIADVRPSPCHRENLFPLFVLPGMPQYGIETFLRIMGGAGRPAGRRTGR